MDASNIGANGKNSRDFSLDKVCRRREHALVRNAGLLQAIRWLLPHSVRRSICSANLKMGDNLQVRIG